MRYCPTCRRYVNGALCCAGCGVAATALPMATTAVAAQEPAADPRQPTAARLGHRAGPPRIRVLLGRGGHAFPFPLKGLVSALLIAGLAAAVLCGIAWTGSELDRPPGPGVTARSGTGVSGAPTPTAPTGTISAADAAATAAADPPVLPAPAASPSASGAASALDLSSAPLPDSSATIRSPQSAAPAPPAQTTPPTTPPADPGPSPTTRPTTAAPPAPARSCLLRLLILCLG